MKVLMITPYLPYPPRSGGQIRSYNLLKNLSKVHEITLFSFVKEIVQDDINEISKLCKKVRVFKRGKAFSLRNVILAGFSPYPLLVAIYYSHSLKKELRNELLENNYDLIHAETFYIMPNLPDINIPVILVEQTIEYLVYDHFVQGIKNHFLRQLLKIDVAKIKYWEKYCWQRANKVVAMSEADKKRMLEIVPNLSCEIVPNGIDTNFFAQVKKKKHSTKTIIFVGNFSWLQNREAVFYLVEEVWPRIIKEIKNVRLIIAGQAPTSSILRLSKIRGVSVIENVEDIRQIYAVADVLVAPIFGPGGTRFKILESMAAGIPVVTTPVGIEGIPAKRNKEVLVGENAREIADKTLLILKNNIYASEVAMKAKVFVNTHFSWDLISEKLNKLYTEIADVQN